MKYLGRAKRREGQKVALVAPHHPALSVQKIPLEGAKVATAVIFEICLEQSTRHQELKWASLSGCFWFVKYLGRAKRREGQKEALVAPHHPALSDRKFHYM